MQNFQEDYCNQMNQAKAPDELVEGTLQKMQSRTCPRRRISPKMALVLAVGMLLISSGSVLAYGTVTGSFRPSISFNSDDNLPDNVKAKVDKHTANNKLDVTVTSVAGDKNNLFVYFTVKSTDGAPLAELTETRKSVLVRQRFADSYLKVNGKKVRLDVFRVDGAENSTTAKFKGIASEKGLLGKDVTLVLKDLLDSAESHENIQTTFDDLGVLYKQMTPCPAEDFIKTGTFMEYADGSKISSYLIPEGNQKVLLSDQFPGAYIDNVGFKQSGEMQENSFYISIVPGSDQDRKKLEKLCFQRIDSGDLIENGDFRGEGQLKTKTALENGRVILMLEPHSFYVENPENFCESDLQKFRLALNPDEKQKIMKRGRWEIPFNIAIEHKEKTYQINYSFSQPNAEGIISRISFSATRLEIDGRATGEDVYFNKAVFVMKDGSKISSGTKGSVSNMLNDDEAVKKIDKSKPRDLSGNWELKDPIDPEQVIGIQLNEHYIPLNES